ncbi:hypothetical protein ACVIIY_007625 [Bradyrhizobium sp. USDA 4515]
MRAARTLLPRQAPCAAGGKLQTTQRTDRGAHCALLSRHRSVVFKRPVPAQLFHSVFSFHFGFSAPVDDLRRRLAVHGQRRTPLVVARSDLVLRRPGCGGILRPAHAFDGEVRALGSPSGESGRLAQTCGRAAEFSPSDGRTSTQQAVAEAAQEAHALSLQCALELRSDRASSVLGMHVKAMNWSGIGHAGYAATLGLSPDSLRIWRDRPEDSGDEFGLAIVLSPGARAQSSSAANCARPKTT